MKRFSMVLAVAAVCSMIAAGASAHTKVSLHGIGLKAGVVNPEDIDATLGMAVVFDMGMFSHDWAFETHAGYWSQTESVFGAEFGVKDFNFGAKAKYMFPTSNATVKPFAGAGLGFHVFDSHADDFFGSGSFDDTDLKIGLDLGGGVKVDRGNQFAFIADAWFTVVSDVSHFSVMLGGVYMLGR